MDRSRARRRRGRPRLESPELHPAPETSTTATATSSSTDTPELHPAPETSTTATATSSSTDTPELHPAPETSALQPQQLPQSPPVPKKQRRGRSSAAKEEKMALVDEWIHGGEEEDGTDQAKKNGDGREKAKDYVAEEEDEVVSSAPSSPLRAPYKPDEHRFNRDPAYDEAFHRVEAKYKEKTARQMKLPTLDEYKPRTRHVKNLKPLSIRESERKTVLRAAKFVLGVSSSVGGEPLRRGSGFWIDWDEDKKTGIVLTTAELLRTHCFRKQEYAHGAEVVVHMRDDTNAKGHLLYYHKHYNLALFRVQVDQPVQLPTLNDKLCCDQEIFELGRDEHLYVRIGHGRVKYSYDAFFGGYHCMGVVGGHEDFEYADGGPVIDFDGNVVGMVMRRSFIPCSILLKCLHLWRKYGRIPRPQLGLQLCAIRVLDLSIVEKISAKCNVDEGLIVKEVSKGSHAEKLGIRVGDVIECFNGECVCNTVELENILLSTCEGHFDKGNDINSKVDIVIRVFHTRKGLRSIKTLAVDLSEQKEDIRRVYYPFTTGEAVSASVSLDQEDSD